MILFGSRIQKLRSDRGWSQAVLAKRLGVSTSMIAHYESGDRFPSLDTLIATTRTFGVSSDYLLGIDNVSKEIIDISGLTPDEIQSLLLIISNYQKTKLT